jgi:hypothetical protein
MKKASVLAVIFAAAALGGAVAQAGAASATHAVPQSGEMSVGGATAAAASSPSCSHLFQGSAHAVFTHLRHAHLRPAPLWPTYLPPSGLHAHWSVYGIRGAPLYPGTSADPLASGSTAYSVNYGVNRSFCTGGAYRGAGFSRTTTRAFRRAVRDSRVNLAPRHVRLGGRNVIEFRPYSSETYWGFLGHGGAYLFYSKDFGGPPSRVIGKMIASLRPITRLRPPA